MPQPKIAILLSSNKPERLEGLFENLVRTIDNPQHIEVLINVDHGDDATYNRVKDLADSTPLSVQAILTPRREGYFTLHFGYNELLKNIASSVAWIQLVNDEIRFLTPGWDQILLDHQHDFRDEIVCYRLSQNKFRTYANLHQAIRMPENFGVYSRRWFEIVESWGEFWGVDSWQEGIHFFLEKSFGHRRSIGLKAIQIENEEVGVGLSPETYQERRLRTKDAYENMVSFATQKKLFELARRVAKSIDTETPDRNLSRFDAIRFAPPIHRWNLEEWVYEFPLQLNLGIKKNLTSLLGIQSDRT